MNALVRIVSLKLPSIAPNRNVAQLLPAVTAVL